MANEPPNPPRDALAKKYEHLKLKWHLVEMALGIFALALFYFGGGSRALAEFAAKAGGSVWGSVAIYIVLLITGATILTLPLGYWTGFRLEHRFNLSNQSVGAWLKDEAKGFALSLVLITAVVEAVYALLRATGDWWWLWTAAFLTAFTLLLSFVLPVIILPIFYKLEPLADETLAARLRAMAEQVGARVVGVFRLGLGEKTKKANAAFAGFGKTRRILLGDTLLANFTPREIEVVLAHELAHFRYHDVWKGLALSTVMTTAGLWLADRWLRVVVGSDLANIEHLPMLALAMTVFALVTSPLSRTWSRRAEYRADWFALDLTRDPEAFEAAMRKLATQNLADLEPHPAVEFLFHDHPALAKRIAKATLWRQTAGA